MNAVSFYTAADSVDYTIKVYDTFQSGQLQDGLISQSGFTQFTGFYTIALPISVTLLEGNDFYVYLSLSQGGQPFDRTSEVPVLLVEESYLTIVIQHLILMRVFIGMALNGKICSITKIRPGLLEPLIYVLRHLPVKTVLFLLSLLHLPQLTKVQE